MKYFFYLIDIFCLMSYCADINDIFDKHLWGGDISVKREIIFMDGFQLSGHVNLGYLIPLGKKYVFSKKNLKESLMPYWFIGFNLNYHVNNFYSGFLELDKVSVNAGTMVDFKNVYAYKFAFIVDFDFFFIQLQIISSSLNVFKKKEIIKYVGIAIGKSFSSYDSIWNVPISLSFSPRQFRRIKSASDSVISMHKLNLYKINQHILDVSQEALNYENNAKLLSYFTCLTRNIHPGEVEYLSEGKKKCYKIRQELVAIEPLFEQYRKCNNQYKIYIEGMLSQYRISSLLPIHCYRNSSDEFIVKLSNILDLMKCFYVADVEKITLISKIKSFIKNKKVKNDHQVCEINITVDSIKTFDLNNETIDGMSVNSMFKEFYKRILFELLIYSNLDEREKFKDQNQSHRESWIFLA